MTLEDIVALVDAHESGTREFKSTTGERRKAAQSLCAMLNHRGGHVLFVLRRRARSSDSMYKYGNHLTPGLAEVSASGCGLHLLSGCASSGSVGFRGIPAS